MIVSLGLVGTGEELPVPSSRDAFTIGSTYDRGPLAPNHLAHGYLHGARATIERVGPGLRIKARGDSELYQSQRGPAVGELVLYAGGLAWIDAVPVIALDAELRALRPRLAQSISIERHAWVDHALSLIATREPLLLLGPPGLGQDAIADALAGTVHRANLDDRRTFTARTAAELFAVRRDERAVFRAVTPRSRGCSTASCATSWRATTARSSCPRKRSTR